MAIRGSKHQDNFLGLSANEASSFGSRFVVLPVPYEATTSYVKGTSKGPQAILKASKQVEVFDEELKSEPYLAGIYTQKPLSFRGLNQKAALKTIYRAVSGILKERKFPVIIGGEHSITPPAVLAASETHGNLSVLQIDAHADLRDDFGGTKWGHASAMRRVIEICPLVQVGIRNICKEEYDFAMSTGQLGNIHFAHEFKRQSIPKIANALSDNVYITVDVDGFDPSLIPSTGTPEPGGLAWGDVLELLREVAGKRKVVGFDLVELSPLTGFHSSDFIAAKLIYKMIGYLTRGSF